MQEGISSTSKVPSHLMMLIELLQALRKHEKKYALVKIESKCSNEFLKLLKRI